MSKNPYEVRLETLKMAKEMVDQEFFLQENLMNRMIDQAVDTNDNIWKAYQEYAPKMYTPQDIINKANVLNEYVSERK